MFPQLEALLQASPKVKSFQVIDNDPIDKGNFLFKIRCELTSGKLYRSGSEQSPAISATLIKNSQTNLCGAGIMLPIFLIFQIFLTITMIHKGISWNPR